MARYSATVTKTTSASAAWQLQIRQASAVRNMRVKEVGLFTTTAVASTLTLERSNSVGATFTSTTGQAQDPLAGAASGVIDTAITTAPTRLGTPVPFRTLVAPAAIGSGAIWVFDGEGLIVPAAGGLLIWQTTTAAVGLALYCAWDE
jgi:hypothetical protein